MSEDDKKKKITISKEAKENINKVKAELDEQLAAAYLNIEQLVEQARVKVAKELKQERAKLKAETEVKIAQQQTAPIIYEFPSSKIELDVGGYHYSTTLETLRSVPGSLLSVMFSGQHKLTPDSNGRYFIDRNGKYFYFILDYLRDGAIELPEDDHKRKLVLHEARFYGLDVIPVDEEDDSLDNTSDVAWTLDPVCKRATITLSNKNLTATHAGGVQHSSVLGTKGFSKGTHVWNVKVTGTAHWVGVGVCLKANLTSDYSTDYSHMWGCSSANQMYNISGTLSTWNTGDEFICTLNCDSGQFTIVGPNTNLVTYNIPIGQELFPIINLYQGGNSVNVIPK